MRSKTLPLLLCVAWIATHAWAIGAEPDPPELVDRLDDYSPIGDVFTKMLWLLGGTVLLLIVASRFLPRFLGGALPLRPGKFIHVVESHRLEPKKSLYLVRVAGRYLLIGTTEQKIELLSGGDIDQVAVAALDDTEPKTAIDPEARAFVDTLRRESSASNPPEGTS